MLLIELIAGSILCTPSHCRTLQWCIESIDMIERAMICGTDLQLQSKQLSSGCPSPFPIPDLPFPLPGSPLPPLTGLGRCQPRCLLDARESRPRWPWVLHSASSTRCTTAAEAAAAKKCSNPELQLLFTHHHLLQQLTVSRRIVSNNFVGSARSPQPPLCNVP